MSYITNDKAITVDIETFWVNSIFSGLHSNAIKVLIRQIQAMVSHHNKLLCIRFDLRLYELPLNNGKITGLNRLLHNWLKSKYKMLRVGFFWCREVETSENPHYHYLLIVDGNKVRTSYKIIEKVREYWERLDGSLWVPQNCYYNIKRGDFKSTQDVVWRSSYLAKTRGKGNKPPQTKNYGSSRIKLKIP
jgi:hypothetical protein